MASRTCLSAIARNQFLNQLIFLMFMRMPFKTSLGFKSFVTQVAGERPALVFCHVIHVRRFEGKSFPTQVTPIVEYSCMDLIMLSKSTFTAIRFLAPGTLVSSCCLIEHAINIFIEFRSFSAGFLQQFASTDILKKFYKIYSTHFERLCFVSTFQY